MDSKSRANQSCPDAMRDALALIPRSVFIMTAAHDNRMAGVCVNCVQVCSLDPPLIAVALLRGQSPEPHIRNNRAFALCQISEEDRYLQCKFAPSAGLPGTRRSQVDANGARDGQESDDPFDCLTVRSSPSGSPIIDRAVSWLDCELVSGVDIEPDHRIYIGRATHGGVLDTTRKPAIVFGHNGAK